jgi:glutamate--cysteine ligase
VRLDRDQLIADYHSWGRPREGFLVGAELERHLLRPGGNPVPYFGEHGVAWLMQQFAGEGWEPYREGENTIAMYRTGSSITLEPGSQFELSTAPYRTVAEVASETAAFAADVDRLAAGMPIHQALLGFTPFAHIPDVPWTPKGRYEIMREHLGQTGDLAHHMMKGTCATQASFDFSDEADAAAKVQLGIALGPLTTAMFANSPISEGRPNGFASYRGHIWTRTDPVRTGFPDAAATFSFERWVDWLLDVPMMFLKHQGKWVRANGKTFRMWMADRDHPPTPEDWDLHLTSVFPEIRVKKTIEVRGADCVPIPLAMSFVALFHGLFYTPTALEQATALAAELASHGTRADRFAAACRDGLKGEIGGRRLSVWAERLLTIAERMFPAEDLAWLAPLQAQVARGESPAHTLMAAWSREPTVPALLRLAR